MLSGFVGAVPRTASGARVASQRSPRDPRVVAAFIMSVSQDGNNLEPAGIKTPFRKSCSFCCIIVHLAPYNWCLKSAWQSQYGQAQAHEQAAYQERAAKACKAIRMPLLQCTWQRGGEDRQGSGGWVRSVLRLRAELYLQSRCVLDRSQRFARALWSTCPYSPADPVPTA